MNQFHINSKGEPGVCSAKSGGCPFGSQSEHHSTAEEARVAYENKRVSEIAPKSIKRKRRLSIPTRETFDMDKHGGFQYDEIFFDEAKQLENVQDPEDFEDPKTRVDPNSEYAKETLAYQRKRWETQAQFERPKSGEKAPIRLLPTGATVVIKDGLRGEEVLNVARPVKVEKSTIGVLMTKSRTETWVNSEDSFEIHTMPDKEVFPSWNDYNDRAKRLAEQRNRYSR